MANLNQTTLKLSVFCYNGCNSTEVSLSETTDAWDECAACGAIMRPEYRDVHANAIAYSIGEPL